MCFEGNREFEVFGKGEFDKIEIENLRNSVIHPLMRFLITVIIRYVRY